jgi:hypothetical protein
MLYWIGHRPRTLHTCVVSLGFVALLQAVCEGVFTVGYTTHRSHEERGV